MRIVLIEMLSTAVCVSACHNVGQSSNTGRRLFTHSFSLLHFYAAAAAAAVAVVGVGGGGVVVVVVTISFSFLEPVLLSLHFMLLCINHVEYHQFLCVSLAV